MTLITMGLPVTFAAALSDDDLALLVVGRIQGEAQYPEGEDVFNRVVARIRQQFPQMDLSRARGIARIAIDTEAGIRWLKLAGRA